MSSSDSYVITIRQGDTWTFTVTYQSAGVAVDLTGYTAEMVVSWPGYRSARVSLSSGEVSPAMAALGVTGVISASLTREQTADIPLSGPDGDGPPVRYQMRIRSGDDPVKTLLSGPVRVLPDVFELVT